LKRDNFTSARNLQAINDGLERAHGTNYQPHHNDPNMRIDNKLTDIEKLLTQPQNNANFYPDNDRMKNIEAMLGDIKLKQDQQQDYFKAAPFPAGPAGPSSSPPFRAKKSQRKGPMRIDDRDKYESEEEDNEFRDIKKSYELNAGEGEKKRSPRYEKKDTNTTKAETMVKPEEMPVN
jgi:hypothetical protein